jgi:hypothetical protein
MRNWAKRRYCTLQYSCHKTRKRKPSRQQQKSIAYRLNQQHKYKRYAPKVIHWYCVRVTKSKHKMKLTMTTMYTNYQVSSHYSAGTDINNHDDLTYSSQISPRSTEHRCKQRLLLRINSPGPLIKQSSWLRLHSSEKENHEETSKR